MDFFSHQDRARRHSLWLVVLFVLAVISLIVITNLLVAVTFWLLGNQQNLNAGLDALGEASSGLHSLFSLRTFLLISLAVCGAVVCAVLYKWFQLSAGGKAVAESLGGRRLAPDTTDPDEKQALNVVEEIALASGMPVPAVYLLEHEMGINAFAAGNRPEDAVIGLTRGCVQTFKRDELQGVVAHEFSHILNGDMRLNIRLIALLHGIVFIGFVGEMLLRGSSRRRKSGGQVALLGLALMVIGWLGTFFGQLIKAAVSRQREYLADASAVQFTRDPAGISNALKLIGGSQFGAELQNDHRSEVSHMFFGQVIRRMAAPFATHPPLMERILRIQPDWDGNYLYRTQQTRHERQQQDDDARHRQKTALVIGAALATGELSQDCVPLDQLRNEIDTLPALLLEQSHDPLGAVALCFALLLDRDDTLRQQQQKLVDGSGFPGIAGMSRKLYPVCRQLNRANRLPLIELLLPTLKLLSVSQYQQFKRVLMSLIRADQQTDMFEWCLYQLIYQYLAPEYEPQKPASPRHLKLEKVSEALQLTLSLLARHGTDNREDAGRAFHRGANVAGLYNLELLPESAADIQQLSAAVAQLARVSPRQKARVISALRHCISQDGRISIVEREMISAMAAIMGSPLPLFIDPQ